MAEEKEQKVVSSNTIQQILINVAVLALGSFATFNITTMKAAPVTEITLAQINDRLIKIEQKMESYGDKQSIHEAKIEQNRRDIEVIGRNITDVKTYQYKISEDIKFMSNEQAKINGWITREERAERRNKR